jgi:N-methylhydantoinase B
VLDYGGPRERRVVENEFHYVAQPGEVMFVQKGGGGGWGLSLERDPVSVLEDVVDDLLSVPAARAQYGVVIDAELLRVDIDATRALRKSLQSEQTSGRETR